MNEPLRYDQHFCHDETVLSTVVAAADLYPEDIVLEIGPGQGDLTRKMAPLVQKVIAIEIDRSLTPYLTALPSNVEVVFGDALSLLPQKKKFHKLVANIPYQICESLLHYLCLAKHVSLSVLMVPASFASKAQKHPIFSAFLDLKIIQDIPKDAFTPPPRVRSAIIKITPSTDHSDDAFIRRKLYLQRDKKLQNGLRDTLIDFYAQKGKQLTKKDAGKIIEEMDLSTVALHKTIARMKLEMYGEMVDKIKNYCG